MPSPPPSPSSPRSLAVPSATAHRTAVGEEPAPEARCSNTQTELGAWQVEQSHPKTLLPPVGKCLLGWCGPSTVGGRAPRARLGLGEGLGQGWSSSGEKLFLPVDLREIPLGPLSPAVSRWARRRAKWAGPSRWAVLGLQEHRQVTMLERDWAGWQGSQPLGTAPATDRWASFQRPCVTPQRSPMLAGLPGLQAVTARPQKLSAPHSPGSPALVSTAAGPWGDWGETRPPLLVMLPVRWSAEFGAQEK